MNIVFRVDSSIQIGAGHVMRCLTLAKKLKNKADVKFICRDKKGNLIDRIMSEGIEVFILNKEPLEDKSDIKIELDWLGVSQKQDVLECTKILKSIKPDWLIVDHYGIDILWHECLQKYYKKLLVIDDLANRQYNCDILLDQNFYQDKYARYENLVTSKCKLLLGPKYALLREEFLANLPNEKHKGINKILVYFGGSDLKNNTLKSLMAIQSCKLTDIHINVIVGLDSPHREDIISFCSNKNNIVCYDFVENMAEMMQDSDLYIGSAGTTTWERCCMGLPSIVIGIAENQIQPMEAMEQSGMTFFLGRDESVGVRHISNLLNKLINDQSVLEKMRKKNIDLVDGSGTSRCISEMLIN